MPPLPPHPPTVHLGQAPQPAPSDDLAPYREAISGIVAAADAGEHARAVREAIALERAAVHAHGTDSEPVLKLRQVRAHVTRLAGLQREAALLYRDVALSLLDTRGADDAETRQAAANAEACWRAIEDDADARRLGPDILRLRQALPDARRIAAVKRHLARLRGEPAPAPEDTPRPSAALETHVSVPDGAEAPAEPAVAEEGAAPVVEDTPPGDRAPENDTLAESGETGEPDKAAVLDEEQGEDAPEDDVPAPARAASAEDDHHVDVPQPAG